MICARALGKASVTRSEEHTSELQSRLHLVCRLLLEKKKYSSSSERSPISTRDAGEGRRCDAGTSLVHTPVYATVLPRSLANPRHGLVDFPSSALDS